MVAKHLFYYIQGLYNFCRNFFSYFRVVVSFNTLCVFGESNRHSGHRRQDVQSSILGKNLDLYHMREFFFAFSDSFKVTIHRSDLQFFLFGKNSRRNSNGLTDACYFTHADTFKYVMRANA